MRRTPSQPPLIAPYRRTASSAYVEQLGANRQGEGNGDASSWYDRITAATARLGKDVSGRANAAMTRDPPRARRKWNGMRPPSGERRCQPRQPKTTRASAGSRGGAGGVGCATRPTVRTSARRSRSVDGPLRCRATKCPVSGFDGGVRPAAPPTNQVRASSASSEECPRASTPSVLGGHRHREALAALLAPAAQDRTAPAGAHPSPKSVLVYAPPIPRLIRPLHSKTTLNGGP